MDYNPPMNSCRMCRVLKPSDKLRSTSCPRCCTCLGDLWLCDGLNQRQYSHYKDGQDLFVSPLLSCQGSIQKCKLLVLMLHMQRFSTRICIWTLRGQSYHPRWVMLLKHWR